MKKVLYFAAIALFISAGVTAQVSTETQVKDQTRARNQIREQVQVPESDGDHLQLREQIRNENHGEAVSEIAKNTDPGPGKGEIVREQAKLKGDAQQARLREKRSARNNTALKYKGLNKNAGLNSQRRTGVRNTGVMHQNMNTTKRAGAGRK